MNKKFVYQVGNNKKVYHFCSTTHLIRSNLCQINFKIVQVHADWKLLDRVTQKAPFDDHAFLKLPKAHIRLYLI